MAEMIVQHRQRLRSNGCDISLSTGQSGVALVKAVHHGGHQTSRYEDIKTATSLLFLRGGLPCGTFPREPFECFAADCGTKSFSPDCQVDFPGSRQHGVTQRLRVKPSPICSPPPVICGVRFSILFRIRVQRRLLPRLRRKNQTVNVFGRPVVIDKFAGQPIQ